mgnify:CR=1 FL=1
MAAFEITGGIDPLLAVTLEKGEAILAESNAMVAMDTALSLKGKTRGGLMGSIARKFMNDETFFQQRIEADDQAGTVLLAPNLPGDVRILDVGPAQYLLSDGAFLACTEGVELSTKSQGIGRALLGDSGGFFVMGTEGSGRIAVSGFGSIRELDVTPERPITVDNGHLVAWNARLSYDLSINTASSASSSTARRRAKASCSSSAARARSSSARATRAASSTGSSATCPRRRPSKTDAAKAPDMNAKGRPDHSDGRPFCVFGSQDFSLHRNPPPARCVFA